MTMPETPAALWLRMSSMTKLNRYICGCNSAVLLRLCPAWLCSNPHVHLAVCGPVCGCLVPTCLLSGCGDSRCSSGPSLYIGCAIPAWSGRPAWPCFEWARGNQRQIREGCSVRCPSRLTMLANLARRRIPPFVQTGAARSLDLWRKRIPIPGRSIQILPEPSVRAAIRHAVLKMGSTYAKDWCRSVTLASVNGMVRRLCSAAAGV
jgi:hypothetical protein